MKLRLLSAPIGKKTRIHPLIHERIIGNGRRKKELSDARKEFCIGEPGTWRCIVLEKLGICVFVPRSWGDRVAGRRIPLGDMHQAGPLDAGTRLGYL
jgi:hypothetical protein